MSHAVRVHYPEAPSGTVAIYKRGSTTALAEVFSDPECETPTVSYVLNAYGRFTGYVLEEVDVRVRDANAAFVDSWTEGAGAPLVEVRDNNFTGTLADGSQGLGGRVELIEVLDRVADSFGADDGFVMETGTATALKLKDALQSVRRTNAVFIVVTDAAYGAVGDGVADDKPAIQKALDAATAAGGGIVYFPPTTHFYLLTAGLSLSSNNVSLLGASPIASVLKITTTNQALLTINAGTAVWGGATVERLGFDCTVGGGSQVQALEIVTAPGYVLRELKIRNFNTGISLQSKTRAENCDYFGVSPASAIASYGVWVQAGGAGSQIVGGSYETGSSAVAGAGHAILANGARVLIDGVQITKNDRASFSGAVRVGAGPCKVTNCRFQRSAGGASTSGAWIECDDVELEESGNSFEAGTVNTTVHVGATTYASIQSYTRDKLRSAQTAGAGTITLNVDFGEHMVTVTGALTVAVPVAFSVAVGTPFGRMLLRYTVRNTTGGALNVTNSAAGSGTHINGAVVSCPAGKTYTITLKFNEVAGAWDEVSFATG